MPSSNPILLEEASVPVPVSATAAAEGTNTNIQIAGAAAAGGKMSPSLRNMGDLKKKAPDVYKAMMQGIAWAICGEMQKHQKRLKELIREGDKK